MLLMACTYCSKDVYSEILPLSFLSQNTCRAVRCGADKDISLFFTYLMRCKETYHHCEYYCNEARHASTTCTQSYFVVPCYSGMKSTQV